LPPKSASEESLSVLDLKPSVASSVSSRAGALIDDAVYQHITTKKPIIKAGRKKCVVNLQVVSVDEDNTYDFVPVIAEGAQELP
jgi:hypothetical protein